VCVLEGTDLVLAALDTGAEFEAVFVDAGAEGDRYAALVARAESMGVRCYRLAAGVIERVADSASPQPVMATVRFDPPPLDSVDGGGLTIVLHEVRDPGNVGTVIRTADAFGASAVVLTGQGVDPYNPKTVRATAGSIFTVPVVVADVGDALDHLGAVGATRVASVVRGGVPLAEVDLSRAAVVLGNESSGLDDATLARCDVAMTIPMVGRSESLNVGVAASVLAFEADRRRGAVGPDRSLGTP
jgi:RNA methyltransferase, TrmH family